jgi:hypothetical protein
MKSNTVSPVLSPTPFDKARAALRRRYDAILRKLDREARADRCRGDICTGWDWPTLAVVKPEVYAELREIDRQYVREFRMKKAAGLLSSADLYPVRETV